MCPFFAFSRPLICKPQDGFIFIWAKSSLILMYFLCLLQIRTFLWRQWHYLRCGRCFPMIFGSLWRTNHTIFHFRSYHSSQWSPSQLRSFSVSSAYPVIFGVFLCFWMLLSPPPWLSTCIYIIYIRYVFWWVWCLCSPWMLGGKSDSLLSPDSTRIGRAWRIATRAGRIGRCFRYFILFIYVFSSCYENVSCVWHHPPPLRTF